MTGEVSQCGRREGVVPDRPDCTRIVRACQIAPAASLTAARRTVYSDEQGLGDRHKHSLPKHGEIEKSRHRKQSFMAKRPIRIGIVGAGANTRLRHIPGFRAIEGVTITAVANRTRASSEKAATELGIPQALADWRAVVESPQVDAVMIGTWPNTHCEITIAALRAGKHVLTEARMARDLSEARQMHAAATAHPQLTAMVVPSPFGLTVGPAVRYLIEHHFLGEIRELVVLGADD